MRVDGIEISLDEGAKISWSLSCGHTGRCDYGDDEARLIEIAYRESRDFPCPWGCRERPRFVTVKDLSGTEHTIREKDGPD